jgi:hypothetical protein
MAFGSFVLTNFGQSQLVKAHKGKNIHFSRMALGDGDIGTSSVFDVVQLKSEKLSLLIDAISITAQEALVTVLLSNALVDTGFNLREMGLMAVDPDTSQEAVYCYNRDSSAGEYIPDKNSSTTLREYLRIHCNVEGVQNITFQPSGNPLFVTPEDLQTSVSSQINALRGVANGLAELDANGKLKQMPTPNDVGAASKSHSAPVTLTAAGWTGAAAPYSQMVSVVGVTTTSVNEILPGASITADQLTALQAANLQDGGQAAGSITLLAYSDKPAIDLPIRVIVRGDM